MSLALTSSIPGADPSWHRRADHPYFKPSHYKLQGFVREYVDEYIAPEVGEWERTGEIPEAVCASFNALHPGLLCPQCNAGIQETRFDGIPRRVGLSASP